MTRLRLGFTTALLLGLLGTSGCKPGSKAGATAKGDAGATPSAHDGGVASPAPPPPKGPWTATLTATFLGDSPQVHAIQESNAVRAVKTEDGGAPAANAPTPLPEQLFVSNGFYTYRIDAEGLVRLGEEKDYAQFVTDLQGEMVGYDAPSEPRVLPTGKSALLLHSTRGEVTTYIAWNGKAWTPSTAPAPDDDGRGAAPGTGSWEYAGPTADGRRVWIGRSGERWERVEIHVRKPVGDDGETIRIEAEPAGARAIGARTCQRVKSARPEAYFDCVGYEADTYKRVERLFRLDGNKLVELSLPSGSQIPVVDTEGNVWFSRTADARVGRRAPDGTITDLELPKVEIDAASYQGSETMLLAPSNGGEATNYRNYRTVRVISAGQSGQHQQVHALFPSADGSVYVTTTSGLVSKLYRMARDGIVPKPLTVGSVADNVNELRNQAPPRGWIGHCPQVFVSLASAPAGTTLDAEAVRARANEIQTLVKKQRSTNKPSASAAIIEGRLGDRPVIGVTFVRDDPEASEAAMEKSIDSIVKAFTTNPTSPPQTSCTLPVVTKLVLDIPNEVAPDYY